MIDTTRITPPTHDDTQEVRGNEHGDRGHRFGNEYDSHEHRRPREVRVGHDDGGVGIDPLTRTSPPGEEIPPDDGARGWIDQRTGEVHGSGSGAGGGQPGEDFDSDAPSGSGGNQREG